MYESENFHAEVPHIQFSDGIRSGRLVEVGVQFPKYDAALSVVR